MAVERVLSKFPKTEVPEDAVCYICMDREGPDGDAVLRGCACRGPSAGFAHAQCLAEMAARDEWMTAEGFGLLSRRAYCSTCHQHFTGALQVEMDRLHWRHFREAPATEDWCDALTNLARTLMCYEEFDVAERLYDEVEGVAEGRSEITRAGALLRVGRYRDALEILTRVRPRMELCEDPRLRVSYQKYLSSTLANVGRTVEALPIIANAVEVARTCHAPQSREMLDVTCLQAQFLAQIDRIEEAKAIVGDAIAVSTRVFGPDHEYTRKMQEQRSRMELLRYRAARTG